MATIVNSGDTAWIIVSTGLVFLMTPALALFYGGLTRSRDTLWLMEMCMLSMAVVSFQWYFWGYSLAFSGGDGFIGDLNNFSLIGVGATPIAVASSIPANVFMAYQGMFAAITPALFLGAGSGRARLAPLFLVLFLWSTLVYSPVAHWIWSEKGWLSIGSSYRVYDFAGGLVVHLTSGVAAAVYALVVGKRKVKDVQPHNVSFVYLGTGLLWFGWLGFNGGSALGANARAVSALIATNLAGSFGGVTWLLLDFRLTGKFSTVAFCAGAVAGLATVTPGSGFIPPMCAVLFGTVAGVACRLATRYKAKYFFDDSLDVFTVHGVSGIVGTLLTGIFASKDIMSLDGSSGNAGGWLDNNFAQLGYQLLGVVSVSLYTAIVTFIILKVVNLLPGMKMRIDDEEEAKGMDLIEVGEAAYGYVEPIDNTLPKEGQVELPGAVPMRVVTSALASEANNTVVPPTPMVQENNAQRLQESLAPVS